MFVRVEIEWKWQRPGLFRGLVDGLVVAQVALVSDRDADPGWIVYLTGRSQALDGRLPTEFDAMAAAEAALSPPAAMIYQHASDGRDRVIADTLGAAIDQWHDGQGDDDGGTAGVRVPDLR
jgi:hypothetical protein